MTEQDLPQTAVDAIARITRETGQPLEIDGIPAVLVPEGAALELHPELAEHPHHIEQKIRCDTPAALVDYVNRFSTGNTTVFCDRRAGKFIAILDYHDHKTWEADWGAHIAAYECPQTPEWQAWQAKSGEWMSQEGFGEHIVDNQQEILSPPGAQMLEIALSLQAKKNVDFRSGIRLDNGEVKLRYEETIESKAGIKGEITIPETITLGLVLFEGGKGYQLDARFRYRIKDGRLIMHYDLIRPHKTHDAAIADIVDTVRESLKEAHFVAGWPAGQNR